jgi:hypothetical protein
MLIERSPSSRQIFMAGALILKTALQDLLG